jgi:hypothetical protein
MLTTLLSITAGTARVAGIDVAADPDAVRFKIGVALQEAGLDPRQNGRELLMLQARLFGMSQAEAATRAEELLQLVELVVVVVVAVGNQDRLDLRVADLAGDLLRLEAGVDPEPLLGVGVAHDVDHVAHGADFEGLELEVGAGRRDALPVSHRRLLGFGFQVLGFREKRTPRVAPETRNLAPSTYA